MLTALLLGALLMAMTPATASNIADTYGFSPTGIAMGNAGVASVEGWSSVWYNMAGLGRTAPELTKQSSDAVATDQLAISYLYTAPAFSISGLDQSKKDEALDHLSFGSIIIGVAFDLNHLLKMPAFLSSARLGVGVAVGSDLATSNVNDIDFRTPNFLRYGREAQRMMMLVGLGFGLFDDLIGVGLGVNFSFTGQGKFQVSEILIEPGLQYPNDEIKMDMGLKPALLAGVYLAPGKLIPSLRGLSLGLAFRQETMMDISPFDIESTMLTAGLTMPIGMSLLDFYSPHEVIAGISWSGGGVTAAFDLEYQMWSGFQVAEFDNPDVIPEMDDIMVVRAGIKWQPRSWLMMAAGYYYQPTFLPDEGLQGACNYMDNTRHVGSLGAAFTIPKSGRMGGALTLSLAYQLQFLTSREVDKTAPTTLNPSHSYSGSAHNLILGVAMSL